MDDMTSGNFLHIFFTLYFAAGLINVYQIVCFINVRVRLSELIIFLAKCTSFGIERRDKYGCDCTAIRSSMCSELEREKAELTLNSVPASDIKSRQTVASLLQQLQKQKQINVRIFRCTLLYHMNVDQCAATNDITIEYNGF